MEYELRGPLTKEKLAVLRAGDRVRLSGTIYSARDQAHKRITESIRNGEEPPFEIEGSVIYYVGPSPAPPGRPVGSAGPTTSYRMDPYAPLLLDLGLLAMIGKGPRNDEVKRAIIRNGAVYFAAVGGAAALISKSIISSEIIAYEDLGAEAVRRMETDGMPLIVAIDSKGNDLYEKGRKENVDG